MRCTVLLWHLAGQKTTWKKHPAVLNDLPSICTHGQTALRGIPGALGSLLHPSPGFLAARHASQCCIMLQN